MRARRFLRGMVPNLLAAAIGIGVTIAVLELGIKMFAPQPLAAVQRDPYLGWLHKPGARFTHSREEFSIPVRYSSVGLRDVEHDEVKPDSTFRIAILGDSFMEANQVLLEQALVRRLESDVERIDSGQRDIETINFGVSGYGTIQYLIVLRQFVLKYDPDLVILSFCLNDIYDNLHFGFARLEGEKLVIDPPRRQNWKGKLSSSAKSFLAQRSHLWTLLSPRLTQILKKRGGDVQMITKPVEGDTLLPLDRLDLYYQNFLVDQTERLAEGWNLASAILMEIQRECGERGVPLIVFLVPNEEQIREEKWEEIIGHYDVPRDRFVMRRPNELLQELCSEGGMRFLDIEPAFHQAADRGEALFFVHDGHWNAAGHALASRTLAGMIEENGLLDP